MTRNSDEVVRIFDEITGLKDEIEGRIMEMLDFFNVSDENRDLFYDITDCIDSPYYFQSKNNNIFVVFGDEKDDVQKNTKESNLSPKGRINLKNSHFKDGYALLEITFQEPESEDTIFAILHRDKNTGKSLSEIKKSISA